MRKTKGEGRAKNEKSQSVIDFARAERAKKRREEEKEWAEKSGPVTVRKRDDRK